MSDKYEHDIINKLNKQSTVINTTHDNTELGISVCIPNQDRTSISSANTVDHDSENKEEVGTLNPIYEFSISTLDRKLKEIKKLRKQKFTKRHSETLSNDNQLKRSLNTSSTEHVTIMINPSKMISEHLDEIQLRIIGHTRAAKMYEKKDKIIGYPVTILSSFLASAIMMGITTDNDHSVVIIKYTSLILSIMSFLFSVSRDYLNFSRKFQSHDLSSKLYTTLLRSIEVRLIKNHIDNEERRDIFKDIVDQMSIIEQYETPIPSKIDKCVRRERDLMLL